MMLRTANNEFIDVDDVEVERQAKLFQNIGDTAGDFSYEFDIENTTEVRSILGLLSPTDGLNKTIYTVSDIDLCDDEGSVLYSGFLRVQSMRDKINVSFFSGNNNWFRSMTGSLEDIDFSEFEVEISQTEIEASWNNTEGIIFPWVNTGAMTNRSWPYLKVEDFQPFIYVKNVIKKCFNAAGLKLDGSLLDDWRYQHLITSTNRESPSNQINARKVVVSKETDQALTGSYAVVEFEIENSVGDLGLWSNTQYRYTADVRMQISAVLQFNFSTTGAGAIEVILTKNGTEISGTKWFVATAGTTTDFPSAYISIPKIAANQIILEAGDYIDVQARETGTCTITSASLNITPVRLLQVFPKWILPDQLQIDFVNSVFKLFNTVVSYDSFTKTVTVDLFRDVIKNDELDLSDYIDTESIEIDYTDIIQEYGGINNLTYSDADTELIKKYNSGRTFGYGSGQINSQNGFIEANKNILQSDFVASAESQRNPFGFSMPEIEFTELEEGQEYRAAVTQVSGEARFTVDENFFPVVTELIEVFSSDDNTYIGQWVIGTAVSDTAFELVGLDYSSDANVRIRRITITSKESSDQVLLLVLPDVEIKAFTTGDIDSVALFELSALLNDNIAYAYFYKPTIEGSLSSLSDAFTKSLSFGGNDIVGAYQRTMIDDYWADLEPILQDPIKVYVDAYLPKSVFESITFKQPIRIKCDQFNAKFFTNRITGYKDSSSPCTLELIKLAN